MNRLFVLIFLLAAFIFPSPAEGQERVIRVGVDPALYDIVVSGVQGWNATNLEFIVEPTGCGTGDVTFCWGTAQPDWVAWYDVGGNVIHVNAASHYAMTPAVACHELGHWLGLHYHRSDYTSCMSDPSPTVASPDNYDIRNLGLHWEPVAEEETPETVITGLPKTGHGPHVGRLSP